MEFNSLPDHDRRFLNRLAATDRAGEQHGRSVPLPVDDIMLAAWLEGQLDVAEAAPIEAALLDNPELLEDLLALRLGARTHSAPDATLLVRARALVGATRIGTGQVVPLVRPAPQKSRPLSVLLSWGAVAASVAVVSLVGFNLGSIVGNSDVVSSSSSDGVVVLNDDLD
jgi:hypothetical protein